MLPYTQSTFVLLYEETDQTEKIRKKDKKENKINENRWPQFCQLNIELTNSICAMSIFTTSSPSKYSAARRN